MAVCDDWQRQRRRYFQKSENEKKPWWGYDRRDRCLCFVRQLEFVSVLISRTCASLERVLEREKDVEFFLIPRMYYYNLFAFDYLLASFLLPQAYKK